MTVLVGIGVVTVLTAGAGAPAAAGLAAGVVQTAVGGAASTAAAVGGSAGAGAAMGAITGAVAGGTAGAAGMGAVAGSTAAAGFTAASAGGAGVGSTLAAGSIAAGPVGWLALGTDHDRYSEAITFDCWKPVLRDESLEPSKGKLLKDVIADERVKDVFVNDGKIILENIWNEQFVINYVTLPSTEISLHASRI